MTEAYLDILLYYTPLCDVIKFFKAAAVLSSDCIEIYLDFQVLLG